MITVSGSSVVSNISVTASGGTVKYINLTSENQDEIYTGTLPQVTVTDPGLSGRVSALEVGVGDVDYDYDTLINTNLTF